MTGGADPVLRVQRREALELLADEIEQWGATIAAQRLLSSQMFHAPTEADRRRAAVVALYLFGADGVLGTVAA